VRFYYQLEQSTQNRHALCEKVTREALIWSY
jgi:hypothetical protein